LQVLLTIIAAGLEVCGPREIELPLQNEKVIKIKATLDRNAAFTGNISKAFFV